MSDLFRVYSLERVINIIGSGFDFYKYNVIVVTRNNIKLVLSKSRIGVNNGVPLCYEKIVRLLFTPGANVVVLSHFTVIYLQAFRKPP